MKILVVTRSLPMHKLGGMEVVAWDLIASFAAAGHDVRILTTPGPDGQTPPNIGGVPALYVDCPSGQYSLRWWLGARRAYVRQRLDEVDVVLSVSAAAISLPLSRGGKGPVSFAQLHGTAVTEIRSKLQADSFLSKLKIVKNLVWMFLDFRYRIFDGFVAVGPTVLDDLRSYPTRLLLGSAPTFLINNGVSAHGFEYDDQAAQRIRAELGIPATARVGICASRLHEQKGVFESLQGFAQAARQDPEAHLIIAGDGPERARLHEFAHSLELMNHVHFVGHVPREKMNELLSASNYFLFTTRRVEGLPMSVLEALAAGLHIILSPGAFFPAFRGQPIDPEDEAAIAEAILAVDMSKPRQSLLPVEYTLEACASGYIELFKRFVPKP